MAKQLRVLIVDDAEDDAHLIVRELRNAGLLLSFSRVATREALTQQLVERWDVLLCDYSMPGFSAFEALDLVRHAGIDLPFIIVSGTVGEARAVEVMRAGAHDYVFKSNLSRLPLAIERELREADNRRERRRLQEQLLLAERMASIGVVAAGVVHEINNPLTVLMGSAELAVRTLSADSALVANNEQKAVVHEELDRVLEAADRLRQIVADVKLFSHAGADPVVSVDVTTTLASSVRMALHETSGRCYIVTRFGETPLVALPASRLGQVFLNLLLNAAQAIAPGNAEQNEIRLTTFTDETGWAVIEVADTGCGIPAQVQKTIFEPFMTTKAVGVGTGLGLFVTHRIVSDAGGRIEFESEVGRGTTFRVRLPASTRPSSEPSLGDSADVLPPARQNKEGKRLVSSRRACAELASAHA
jgi:signal transduction histidine kinase